MPKSDLNPTIHASRRQPFSYKPLDDSNEIRLLYMRSREGGVQCNISHVKFSENPEYEALSYEWGTADQNRPILIDNKEFWIRNNLHCALQHVQPSGRDATRVLWIDAICINQDDVKERNHQVTQMGNIYTRSWRVVAWLGLSNSLSSEAIKLISSFDNLSLKRALKEIRTFTPLQIEAITSFCTRSYWSRLWIIQEIVLPFNIRIQCGTGETEHCEWKSMYRFFQFIDSKTFFPEIRKSIPARLFRQWRDLHGGHGKVSGSNIIFDLCLRYTEAKCAEPRDKIFGLIGIAADCCKDAVAVDYSLSMYEICGMVLEHHTTIHIADSFLSTEWEFILDPDRDKSAFIIPTSQLFQRAMGIVSSQCPTPPLNAEDTSNAPLMAINNATKKNDIVETPGNYLSISPGHAAVSNNQEPDVRESPTSDSLIDDTKDKETDSPVNKNTQRESWRSKFRMVTERFKRTGQYQKRVETPSFDERIADARRRHQERVETPLFIKRIANVRAEVAKQQALQRKRSELLKAPEVPIRLEGMVRGRIVYLSPSVLGSEGVEWSESQTFMGSNTFIEQELERIKVCFETKQSIFSGEQMKGPFVQFQQTAKSLVVAKNLQSKELNEAAKGLVNTVSAEYILSYNCDTVFNRELDLVCSNMANKSAVVSRWAPDPKTTEAGMAEQSPDTSHSDHISELLGNLLDYARIHLYMVGRSDGTLMPRRDCRVAIEENGFICFVPNSTQVDDFIFFFPQSDVVAIVHESEQIGQLVGRAVGFFKHASHTPLRAAFQDWPSLDLEPEWPGWPGPFRGVFFLDVRSLQLLTHGSCLLK